MICLACQSPLSPTNSGEQWITCVACGRHFPLIGARLPVLVETPLRFLVSHYLQQSHYLRREQAKIDAIRAAAQQLLPLPAYIHEITRLLKSGGLFIHFEPLDYHFTDLVHHLSAEEIRNFFADSGFDVVLDATVQTEHLPLCHSMAYRIYDSWVLGVVRL